VLNKNKGNGQQLSFTIVVCIAGLILLDASQRFWADPESNNTSLVLWELYFFTLITWPIFIASYYSWIEINQKGIFVHSPWRSRRFIDWESVASYKFLDTPYETLEIALKNGDRLGAPCSEPQYRLFLDNQKAALDAKWGVSSRRIDAYQRRLSFGVKGPRKEKVSIRRYRGSIIFLIIVFMLAIPYATGFGVGSSDVALQVTSVGHYIGLVPPQGYKFVILNGTIWNDNRDEDGYGIDMTFASNQFELRTDMGHRFHYDPAIPRTTPIIVNYHSTNYFSIGFTIPVDENPSLLIIHWGMFTSSAQCPK